MYYIIALTNASLNRYLKGYLAFNVGATKMFEFKVKNEMKSTIKAVHVRTQT